jgi:hypothetical protein
MGQRFKPNEQTVDKTPFTPEEFTKKAQELWEEYQKNPIPRYGHLAVDNFMWDVLYAAGYEERLEILDQIPMTY